MLPTTSGWSAYDLVVGSPLEFPTDIHRPAFLVDLGVFWFALLVGGTLAAQRREVGQCASFAEF